MSTVETMHGFETTILSKKKEIALTGATNSIAQNSGAVPAVVLSFSALMALGTIAIVIPYLFSGTAAVIGSMVSALLFFTAAAMTWRELFKNRDESQQETLLREAFHSVLTPQLITDESGNLLLANRAFRGWIDLGSQSAEQALAARFAADPAVTAEFKEIKVTMQKGPARHRRVAGRARRQAGRMAAYRLTAD